MGMFGTNVYDEESEPEESVPGGVDGTQNSSNANKLGTGCFGTFDKCVLANISVRRGWKKPKQGVIDFNTIKAATHNFSHANKLGIGGFGSVYKGVLPNGTSIAVKQFSVKSEQAIREFESVIASISDLQHPHIVRLLGYCAQDNQPLLVYEYMENNSLQHALFGSEELRMRLNWPTRVKICVGIAKGLAFLHEESQKKIIHRGIKPANILLDKNLNPKISDFGLATPYGEYYVDTVVGTIGYLAPEYIRDSHLTEKVDVYSFGAVTLEIVSGQKIFTLERADPPDFLLNRACMLQEEGNLGALVDPTLGSNYRQKAVAILDLALMCTHPVHTLRPKMSVVVKMLEANSDTRTLERNLEMENCILGLSQSTQSAGSTSHEQASEAIPSRSVDSGNEISETSNLLDDDDDDGDVDNMNLFFLFLFWELIFLCFVHACKKCLLAVW